MIHITVEMWPYGDEKRKRLISTINVANAGRDKSSAFTNYVVVSDTDDGSLPMLRRIIHRRQDGIFWLLYNVISSLIRDNDKNDV